MSRKKARKNLLIAIGFQSNLKNTENMKMFYFIEINKMVIVCILVVTIRITPPLSHSFARACFDVV